MSVSVPHADFNIQEKEKTTTNQGIPARGEPLDPRIRALSAILRSPHLLGEVLRVLADRLRNPDKPYTSRELEILLLLTLALEHAGMWPL
jgi:hypothetical protein